MMRSLKLFLKRLRLSKNVRLDLDVLVGQAPIAKAPLRERILWLIELIQWVRLEGNVAHQFDFGTGEPQAARVKYFLQILDRNPEWKVRVSATLNSILADTQVLELFMNAGISESESFLAELTERVLRKILPQPPNDEDLTTLFSEYLKEPKDVAWISSIDSITFSKLLALFQSPEAGKENTILRDANSALQLLGMQVRAAGLSTAVRLRLRPKLFTELPFFKLPSTIDRFLAAHLDHDTQMAEASQLERVIEDCYLSLSQVRDHLDDYGVNISIVYSIAKIESQLSRIRDLSLLVTRNSHDHQFIADFMAQLIAQNSRRHSVGALFSDNFSLVSRKITERSAETGEHYILRSFAEHRLYFRKALGGGVVTCFTTLLKYGIYGLHFPGFITGIANSINYSLSFLIIHFAGFTLGTKQPAMTAPALAAKMHKIRDAQALSALVDEIVHIIRSQWLAVVGNVVAAVPLTYLICWLFNLSTGDYLLVPEKAIATMNSFSILGMTPLWAAFTGVLLWVSSLIAGWVDNWFAYRQLPAAISANRRLVFIVGEAQAEKLGVFLKQNISAITGNISLAFLLGMIPVVAQFFVLPIDVRHVTLSSASLAAAAVSFPTSVFTSWNFWLAVFGIGSMGILNISVSFSLAIFVAIRAKTIQAPERSLIYRAVWNRFRASPISFILPPREANTN